MSNIEMWIFGGSIVLASLSPVAGGGSVLIKNRKKRNKYNDVCISVMLGSFLTLALVMLISAMRRDCTNKSGSKDTTKTAQVQKFRTMVNNYKTANWNDFARKVK